MNVSLDIPLANGEVMCLRNNDLPQGGRMLTFADVPERAENTEQHEELAGLSCTSGVFSNLMQQKRPGACRWKPRSMDTRFSTGQELISAMRVSHRSD